MKRIVWIRNVTWQGLLVFLLILCAAFMVIPLAGGVATATANQNMTKTVLTGKTIAIDAGHGGYDPGAIGVSGSLEKDINLALALKVQTLLMAEGAEVVMTRKEDTCFSETKRTDLNARADLVAKARAEIFLSIQCNALPQSSCRGAQVFYYPGSAEGERLAVALQTSLRDAAPDNTREALAGGTIYILRALKIPAVIVEVGFLSNPAEEALLLTEEYQDKMAAAIVGGLRRYYEESAALMDVITQHDIASY